MLVERFEIRCDSGGPGAYRGGLGITKVYRTLEDCLAISVMDRVKGAVPPGLPHYTKAGWLFDATAAQREQLPTGDIELKKAESFTIIGKPVTRIDNPDVVTGKAMYGLERAIQAVHRECR